MSVQDSHPFAVEAQTLQERLAFLQSRLAGRFNLGMYSEFTRYGLCRDLAVPIVNPTAKIPIAVRPLRPSDLKALFGDAAASNAEERREVAWRQGFVDKDAPGGYVAVDERNDTPCYVQWLLGPKSNDFISSLGGFPALTADEALLENAYTPPAYRGFGIMSAAMALIAARGSDVGARYVITFVDRLNIASLKGCQRAGFYPQRLHNRKRYGFGLVTRDNFEMLPPNDPRRTQKF